MNEDPAMWLAQEVIDLLPVSPVGLGEFIWILQPKFPDMADSELI